MRFLRRGKDSADAAPQEPARPEPVDVAIRDEVIRLGQFLKLANMVETGAEAKPLIAEGLVTVNGEVDTRRGRQLVKGDVVELGGQAARVADESAGDDLPW
jgi:ribosome-associated protein